MEKAVNCERCGKRFVLVGNRGDMPEKKQMVKCPKCGFPQEVLWPVDMGWKIATTGE